MIFTKARPGDFLKRIRTEGIRPGLDGIEKLLDELGNPQSFLKCIHVAGTNGKGSLCMFLTSIFGQAGIRCGSFNTPAVYRINEMFTVDGQPMNDDDFVRIEGIVQEAAESVKKKYGFLPTEFECETAMAFVWFHAQDVQIVLLECGMGGRLDATNIISSNLCAAITSVSLEHTAYLGNSVEEIAEMKAGIIKDGSPVFVPDALPESVLAVIRKHAFFHNGYMFYVKEYREIPFAVPCQYRNAGLAVDICYYLNSLGYRITETQMREGLQEAVTPGRFEQISDNPPVLLDGAHNPEAAEALAEALQLRFPKEKVYLIYGAMKDKDAGAVLSVLAPLAKEVFLVGLPSERGRKPSELAEIAGKAGFSATVIEEPKTALRQCLARKDQTPVICCGSFSFLYQIKECFTND